ncbi:hypothetical protein [Ancylobacter oerskovii]|uniref:Uncharacterized protein n=1 Tax=Ancylobacter oerskovii TaxID=459519 RepID=A0ABW4Z2W2_9HYPH|nr:hypothetical protein [Ancylobacter oerskovii]MBS7546249.1 hypothetical protein [Ancylobacter oerskovii]
MAVDRQLFPLLWFSKPERGHENAMSVAAAAVLLSGAIFGTELSANQTAFIAAVDAGRTAYAAGKMTSKKLRLAPPVQRHFE